jgi:hypothetical protein
MILICGCRGLVTDFNLGYLQVGLGWVMVVFQWNCACIQGDCVQRSCLQPPTT